MALPTYGGDIAPRPQAAERTFLGYPHGMFLLVAVEFWERFSYYGIVGILVLFLTAPVASLGLGWDSARALRLLGLFTGLAFSLPLAGGFVADRFLGSRKSILIGGSLIAGGNLWIAGCLSLAHGALRYLAVDDLSGQKAPAIVAEAFYAGLTMVVLGNALLKSPLLVMLGQLFSPSDPRRPAAYSYYYMSINIGSLVAALIVGAAAAYGGWYLGFLLTGIGMVMGLLLFWNQQDRLPPASVVVRHTRARPKARRSELSHRAHRNAYLAVGCCGVLAVAFATVWFQYYGLWVLYIQTHVDRSIGGFTVPVPWFIAVNSAAVIALSPVFAWLWTRLRSDGRDIDYPVRFIAGFIVMAGAQSVLLGSSILEGHSRMPVSALWPVVAYLLLTISELIYWPTTYDMVYQLVPAEYSGTALGAWVMTLGIGQFAAGELASVLTEVAPNHLFGGLALSMLFAAMATFALRPWLLSLRSNPENGAC